MARLRAPDDSVARFRQKPPNDRLSSVHAGQQPPGPPASDRHYDQTRASQQANIDQQRAEVTAAHDQGRGPTVMPQGNEPFMHYGSTVTPIRHPGAR